MNLTNISYNFTNPFEYRPTIECYSWCKGHIDNHTIVINNEYMHILMIAFASILLARFIYGQAGYLARVSEKDENFYILASEYINLFGLVVFAGYFIMFVISLN